MSERTIFIGALERQAPADRLAYLAEACGTDAALRARVEALLRENEELGSFLESPAAELAALNLPAEVAANRPIDQELGDFCILREIGRGGMGIVYEAVQVSLGRHVALKVLPAHSLLDENRLQRFEREAKAAARLHHNNIVPIHGVGVWGGTHYLVMQFIAGQSLDHVLDTLRKQPTAVSALGPSVSAGSDGSGRAHWDRVARVGLHVAEALDYAAQQGVLHRDIKPANLLLDEAGQVWVTDFGLAKLVDSDDLTHSGEILGTLRYMAPERFQNRFDASSDVYSLGLTLYELLTLRPAYEEADRRVLVARILSAAPPRPRQLNRAIPRDLETIVLKASAREPRARYASAGELAEDLQRFLADRPILARRSSVAEQAWRWGRRNPAWAALLASVVVLGMALVVISSLTALWLGERAAQAEMAERKVTEQLWVSKRDQARAMRMSRRPGQRTETLRVIKEAMQLPVPPGHSLAELRTEAIAALALPDIKVERAWEGGMTPGIVGLALDRNLNYCARLAVDGTVTVNRVSDGQEVARWRQDAAEPWRDDANRLCLSEDGHCLCIWQNDPDDCERLLAVWRWGDTGSSLAYQCVGTGEGDGICFTPDSTRLVHVLPDSSIAVVDLASGQPRYLPPTEMERVCIQGAPDSRRLAISGFRDGKMAIAIIDLTTGRVQTSFRHPTVNLAALEWHPDGTTLATAGNDRMIRLWDVSRGKQIRTFAGHTTGGIHSSFDVAGGQLLSNDWGDVLRLWEPSTGRQLLALPAKGSNLLQVSPDNRLAALSVADATTLQLLRLHGTGEYRSLSCALAYGNVVVHPAGRLAAVGDEGPVILLDLATGRELGRLLSADRPLRWDSAGRLLTCGGSGLLSWPVQIDAEQPERYRLGPPERLLASGVKGVQWGASKDVRTIAIPNRDQGTILLQRGPSLKNTCLAPQQDVRNCAVSPNGEWVASGSHTTSDGIGAKIWETATGREVMELPVPKQCRPTFSPDGRWLLTNAGGCRLWRVSQHFPWAEGPTIGGPWGCFSPPDGRLLAVEDAPGTIRLVETDTGTEVVRLDAPEPSRMSPQCFSPDGTRLIAWGHDTGSLHIWDLQLLRQQLVPLDLDWKAPSYPPAPLNPPVRPLHVEILAGHLR
jgi:WD40 repeat protein/tRNA A-37 threonylcarbamoyl transferase component Bud32